MCIYIYEIYKRNQFRNSKRKLLHEIQSLHRPKLFAESSSSLRSGYARACNSISGQHKAASRNTSFRSVNCGLLRIRFVHPFRSDEIAAIVVACKFAEIV